MSKINYVFLFLGCSFFSSNEAFSVLTYEKHSLQDYCKEAEKYPGVGRIILEDAQGQKHFGTGSIVNIKEAPFILTAAHLFEDASQNHLTDFSGCHPRTSVALECSPTDGTLVASSVFRFGHRSYQFYPENVMIHKDYDEKGVDCDLALIRIPDSLQGLLSKAFSMKSVSPGENITDIAFIGHGEHWQCNDRGALDRCTAEGSPGPKILARMKVKSNEEIKCGRGMTVLEKNLVLNSHFDLKDDFKLAGAPLLGDGGGPCLRNGEIIGVISTGSTRLKKGENWTELLVFGNTSRVTVITKENREWLERAAAALMGQERKGSF